MTVFMSSHILGEVDLLANRIGIVHRGRLVEELDSDALEQRRDRRLEVEARDLERPRSPAGGRPHAARACDGERSLELRDPMALEAPEKVAEILSSRPERRRPTSRSPGSHSRSISCASPADERGVAA